MVPDLSHSARDIFVKYNSFRFGEKKFGILIKFLCMFKFSCSKTHVGFGFVNSNDILSGGEKSLADDVTVDAEGNAYITDAKGTQIWKVGVDGQLLSVIKSPLFHAKEWYNNIFTLNGIVYHPNEYLIVGHTITGNMFKVEIKNENKVTMVKLDGSLKLADGLEILSATKIVVAGANGVKLVESNDDWVTASVIGRSPILTHRMATAAMVKDGKVYINHALGMGYPKKKHVLVEAAFC